MPLENAVQWKDRAVEWMVDRLRTGQPPDSLAACLRDGEWSQIYYFFAEANFVTENLDFLHAVEGYRTNPTVVSAEGIYNEFVPQSAPKTLNLYSGNREALDEWFRDQDHVATVDLYDEAYSEIFGMTDTDSYRRFQRVASEVKRDLAVEEEAGQHDEDEPEMVIGAPTAVQMTRAQVDDAVVDNWNEQALKSLDAGASAAFYEIDDLVIIDARQADGIQPYVSWAKQHPDVDRAAQITMTKKGGAFDPGAIRATGVQRTGSFEAAVKRVSKKKVTY